MQQAVSVTLYMPLKLKCVCCDSIYCIMQYFLFVLCINALYILCCFCFTFHWILIFHMWNVGTLGYKLIFYTILIIFMQFVFNFYFKLPVKQGLKCKDDLALILCNSDMMKGNQKLLFYHKKIEKMHLAMKTLMEINQIPKAQVMYIMNQIFFLHKQNLPIPPFIFYITTQNFAQNLKINLYYQRENLK